MSREAFILSAQRTPIGRFGGGLASVPAVELARTAVVAALEAAHLAPGDVEHVILGMARQAGNGPNPGRHVAFRAGVPVERPAYTVNQACASGLLAISQARDLIRLGEADVVVAAGTESMSRVPYLVESASARWGGKMGDMELVDAMYRDGFQCPLADQLMGRTAETLAHDQRLSRHEQDGYAVRSQQLAADAIAAGRFDAEIAPVTVKGSKGATVIAKDEHPRAGTTVESLRKLDPVFLPEEDGGTVTAGNSSGVTDGAAAVVVVSEKFLRERDLQPMARIRASVVVGVDPKVMGIGPVPATRRLLELERLQLSDIDLVELNEAFAAQVLACCNELDLPPAKLNVNGGSIALGHPIGCTGTRIAVTLLHEMERRESKLGLATLCVSGGLGFAMLFEREA